MVSPQRVVSLFDMLEMYGDGFVKVIHYFAKIGALFDLARKEEGKLEEETAKQISSWVTRLQNSLGDFEAPATKAATAEVRDLLKNHREKTDEIATWINQISSRLEAELKGKSLLLLTAQETKRLDALGGFGKEVGDKFPTAVEDIAESSKCLGLGRYTASVFHLMRAMECAVQALSGQLGISDTEREWGKLLSDMEGAIEALPKGDLRDEWSASHSHLYHVKQAWRNKTMHPKKTYTGEEAEAVFAAVRSFMRHLAPLIPAPAGP